MTIFGSRKALRENNGKRLRLGCPPPVMPARRPPAALPPTPAEYGAPDVAKKTGDNGEAVEDCVRQLVIRPERCGRPDGSRRELVANIEIRRALISGQVKRIRRVVTAGKDRAERRAASAELCPLSVAFDNV